MKFFVIAIVCACLAVVLIPIRRITESSYSPESQELSGGTLRIQFDATFSKKANGHWYDGSEGNSPYRIRLIFKPSVSTTSEFQVENLKIVNREGRVLVELPASVANVQLDQKKETILIVGYSNVTLDTAQATMELAVRINGVRQFAKFELKKETNTRLIHSGWESLSSI